MILNEDLEDLVGKIMLTIILLIFIIGGVTALNIFKSLPGIDSPLYDCINLGRINYTDYYEWKDGGVCCWSGDFQLDDGTTYKNIYIKPYDNKITAFQIRNHIADLYTCKTTNLFNEEITTHTIKAMK